MGVLKNATLPLTFRRLGVHRLAGSVERKSGLNPARNLLNTALVTIAVEFAAVAIDVAVFAAEFAALVAGGGVVAVPQVTA
jgi:hypothetical protein